MNKSLILSFSKERENIELYWIKLKQKPWPTDAVSVSQAAESIDAVYKVPDPCQDPNSLIGGKAAPATPPTDKKDFVKVASKRLDFSGCLIDVNGNYKATISVYISHVLEKYSLRGINCEIGIATVVEEDVEEVIKSGGLAFNTSKPLDRLISCSVPISVIKGSTVNIRRVTNIPIFIKYHTRYENVSVEVKGGANGEPTEGVLFGFFHKIVNSIKTTTPPVDKKSESISGICPSLGFGGGDDSRGYDGDNPPPEDAPVIQCYDRVTYQTKCQCSGDVISEKTYDLIVECPASITKCSQNEAECRVQLNKYTVTAEYKGCGETSELHDREYYKQVCCEYPDPTKITLPNCKTTKSVYFGGHEISGGADFYKSINGGNIQLIPVPPKSGICGTTEVNQDVKQKNCCDGVTPIYWDYDNSAEVIAGNSKGLVVVTGGQAPYTWQVRGSGFWANEACTWRDVVTDVPYLWIYTKDACGPCYIWANDGCSDTSGLVRSTVGQWVLIAEGAPCQVQLSCGPATFTIDADTLNTCISGRYKIEETWGGEIGALCCGDPATPCDPYSYPICDPARYFPITSYNESCAFLPPTGFEECSGMGNLYWKAWPTSGCVGGPTIQRNVAARFSYTYEWQC